MSDSNFIKPLGSFVEEAVGYLPDYLKKDNLTKFLTVFLERLETLDSSFISLAEFRLLSNAEGVVLDGIGEQMALSFTEFMRVNRELVLKLIDIIQPIVEEKKEVMY